MLVSREARYELHPKSGTWVEGKRLARFDLTVGCEGTRVGGNNIQAVVGAPGERRDGLDRDVFLWLDSGWWVTLRNEFSRAPDVARRILESAAPSLCELTSDPRGADASILGSAVIPARGRRALWS